MHHPFLSSSNLFHSIQFLHSSQTQFCVIDRHPKVSASSFHGKSNKLPQASCQTQTEKCLVRRSSLQTEIGLQSSKERLPETIPKEKRGGRKRMEQQCCRL